MRLRFFRVTFIGLFALTVSAVGQSGLPDLNRTSNYDVQHYIIRVSFDRKKKLVNGDTTVILKPTTDKLKKVELDAAALKFTSIVIEPSNARLKYIVKGEKVIVELDRSYSSDDVISLRFKYTAIPQKGIYFVDEKKIDGKVLNSAQIWTQGEADEAHHWFPSFDFPSDKATSEELITADAGETVIGNGILLDKKINKNGTETHHFKMDIPHSTYLTSFIIGKYVKTADNYGNIPVNYYVYPGIESIVPIAFGDTKEMIGIFEDLTKTKFPYNKYDQTIVSGFQFGGMENITATTMADSEIFFARLPFARGIVTDLVSHELAHSWFGNLVTCRNWAELWLNEGFATFMEAAYREKKYGREDYDRKIEANAEEYLTGRAASKKEYGLFNRTAGNIPTLFDVSYITYDKGGAVLHTLREQIGDEAFWSAVKLYLDSHARGNVESTDLRKAMEETSKQDLGWFFDQWVYATGAPSLQITPTYNVTEKKITLNVSQTQKAEGLVPLVFRLPIEIEFKNGETVVKKQIDITKRTENFTFDLDTKPDKILVDPKNKIPLKMVKIGELK